MCLYPGLIPNKKYTPNRKNGGIVDYAYMNTDKFDKRVLTTPIGCGECIECRKQKATEWQVRLLEDVKHNKNGKFLTLTFNNESIKKLAKEVTQKTTKTKIITGYEVNEKGELEPKYKRKEYKDKNGKTRYRYSYRIITEEIELKGYETDNAIATLALRKWLERWRKKYGKSLRHWMITELGHKGTENIHMHGIVWTDEDIKIIEQTWNYGYIWIGEKDENGKITNYVNEKTVNYITKYVQKMDLDHKYYKSKILTSAGIGEDYFKREDSKRHYYVAGKTRDYYTTNTGHKMKMPKYYRNKIYTDEQRELLWLEMLNKQERYILGEKIDVSTIEGIEDYYGTLQFARRKNREKGYGTGTKDWNQKKYEEDRRNMLMQKRIQAVEEENIPTWVTNESEYGYHTDNWMKELEEYQT